MRAMRICRPGRSTQTQSLDVARPCRGLRRRRPDRRGATGGPPAYEVAVVTPGRRRRRAQQRPAAERRAAARAARRDRHAPRRRRRGRARGSAPTTGDRAGCAARRRAPGAWLGVHRRVRCSRDAGLLDGRRATTHWAWCDALARALPAASTVDPDPIFVRDGDVWTSAGVDRGHGPRARARRGGPRPRRRARGRALARALPQAARRPVAVQRRPRRAGAPTREPLRELQAWIADHLDADLAVAALAARART